MFLFSTATAVIAGTVAAVVANDAAQQPLLPDLNHFSSSDKTIYNVLSHHHQFSKLIKAVDFADNISSVLNDSSAQITFFAVPNSALHRPHKRHFDTINSIEAYDLADAVDFVEEYQSIGTTNLNDDDDEDKERRREFLKKLVQAILSYHILPNKYNMNHLAENNTFATALALPDALDGRSLRIRVAHNPFSPIPIINFYSTVIRPDNKALNGIFHVVNHPLLPPPSVFQDLFLVPSIFATFTSAVQRTGLTDLLDLHHIRGKKGDKRSKLEGSKAVTVFAPTNRAFRELPRKLRLFLFSPLGTHVLKKILEYHIVPDVIFHSDYVHNATGKDSRMQPRKSHLMGMDPYLFQCQSACPETLFESGESPPLVQGAMPLLGSRLPRPPIAPLEEMHLHPKPIITHDATLKTALTNHTLHAHVEKFKFSIPLPGPHHPHKTTTKFSINGHQVKVPDIIGLNGAIHLIEHLLDPRGHSHHDQHSTDCAGGTWGDWEEWLPQWAAEI